MGNFDGVNCVLWLPCRHSLDAHRRGILRREIQHCQPEMKNYRNFSFCARLNTPMKATITLIAALALASTAATSLAQTPAPSPSPAASEGSSEKKHREHGGQGLLDSLNLTPDQKAKIDVLRADLRSKVETINSNAELTPEQKKEQIQALRKANRTQIEAILTPDQLAQLQKAKAERGDQHKAGGEATPQASPTP